MYAPERQQLIAGRARAAGRVEVATLAVEFDVTPETIRRDLTTLERRGVLRRVHGGAIPSERLSFEPALDARGGLQAEQKERIAKAAIAELPADGAILLDAGSSTARLADLLPADRTLTVVTNSLPTAVALAARPSLTVQFLGGRIRGRTMAAVDSWGLRVLADTFVDVAFIGTNGLSVPRGLTTPDPSEAATKSAMLTAARRTVVLADHTKFGQVHLARFGGLEQVDVVITDDGLDPGELERVEQCGPRVVTA